MGLQMELHLLSAFYTTELFDAFYVSNQKPTNWLGQVNAVPQKLDPKAVGGGISAVFELRQIPPGSSSDVISAVMDVRVKFGGSRLNSGRIITLGRLVPFYALLWSI